MLQNIVWFFVFFFRSGTVGAIPGAIQDLFLVLCTGFTHGDAWETICSARNSLMQASALNPVIYLWPSCYKIVISEFSSSLT